MHKHASRARGLLYFGAALLVLAASGYVLMRLLDTPPELGRLSATQIDMGLLAVATVALLSAILLLQRLDTMKRDFDAAGADFIAVASHELRSPLSGIRWSLAALRNDATLEPNLRDVVNDLYRRVCALIDLTSTFLLTASADHGIIRAADFKLVNMAQIISAAIAHAQSFAQMKQIKIRSDFEPNASISIKGDGERLRLVFDNILSNAIKYSPNDSSVSISYEEMRDSKRFKVSDQGMGIPKDEVAHIFGGFHRAPNARRSGTVGSGFGLYLAKKIVDFHGGSISCESEVGHGTTFTITLPTGV